MVIFIFFDCIFWRVIKYIGFFGNFYFDKSCISVLLVSFFFILMIGWREMFKFCSVKFWFVKSVLVLIW